MRRRPLKLAAVTLAVLAVERVLARVVPDSVLHTLAVVLLVGCGAVVAFLALRWLWRKLTYRVGARLFWSYLLIGLVPFPLLALLGAAAVYMFVGQYASVRFGETLVRCNEALATTTGDAARVLAERGVAAATDLLTEAQRTPPPPLPRLEWIIASGAVVARSAGAANLPPPLWVGEGSWSGDLRAGDRAFTVRVERRGDRLVACLLPLDLTTARGFSQGRWFEVRFATGKVWAGKQDRGGEGVSISIGDEAGQSSKEQGKGGGASLSVGGEKVRPEEVEPGWTKAAGGGGRLLERPWVMWFRPGPLLRSWDDGTELPHWRVVALLRTSVGAAWRDFSSSKYETGDTFLVALEILGAVCAVLYGIAVALAAVQILTITRSTARLTRGSREVASGNLDYRIPVKRRDQLGDLAVSFNRMTDSVKAMLVQVAEKEHLARELELAREIQEGLLPPTSSVHGEISMFAHFRPAAEVGGDYFDVIPLDGNRLVVGVGDVAGHGVSTGLLMAVVKSAVATLVHEGRQGVDLIQRLNTMILENPRRHRTATLLLVEIDSSTSTGEVRLTSAGHPPAFLISRSGEVKEVLLSALPLGHPWPDPPLTATEPFPTGSRLVLYSDGLVEAQSVAGAALGYEGLHQTLAGAASLPANELLRAVLTDLDRHVGARPLADDLTVLVVERGQGGHAGDPPGSGQT
jgi:serine phosphatase RsbU (regulator of sigma subunit)